MTKEPSTLNFSEKERICETNFISSGPYWHICTDGTKMQAVFRTKHELDTAMWMLAKATCKTPEVHLITFEIMDNHIHLIAAGRLEDCIRMFETFQISIKKVVHRSGNIVDWKNFKATYIKIESLSALRNEIIYTNRNAFVANPNYTPCSYPWGGGCAYFCPWLEHLPTRKFEDLTIDTRRNLIHSKDLSHYSSLRVLGENVHIPSFCDISLGEGMFRDSRSYFMSLTRNSEAFSMIASRLKDSVFLTDEEIYSILISYIDKEFHIKQVAQLSPDQKLASAKHLHFKYNASNQQIRRMLRIDINILKEIFPEHT
jgi:hypothetical protein